MSIILKSGSSTDVADVTPGKAVKVDASATVQPVSVSGTLPADVTDRAVRLLGHVSVDSLPSISGSVSVSNFPVTQPVSGTVAVSGIVATTQQGGLSGLLGDVQIKGVQGNNALVTQDFKDSGRVMKIFSATFTPSVAEAMVTLTPISDGVAGATSTSFTVTSGKRLRLQNIAAAIFNTTAAIRSLVVNLRMTSTGAVTTASPLVSTLGVPSTAAATASLTQGNQISLPDGMEFSGTMQIGISAEGIALAGCTVTLIGYEY